MSQRSLFMRPPCSFISSRGCCCRVESAEDGTLEDDPRQELVARLLEYQRIKEAAQSLAELHSLRQGLWTRQPQPIDLPAEDDSVELEEVSLFDLLGAFKQVLVRYEHEHPDPFQIHRETFSVRGQFERLLALLDLDRPYDLLLDLRRRSCRSEAVAAFLAILELARLDLVRLHRTGGGRDTALPHLEGAAGPRVGGDSGMTEHSEIEAALEAVLFVAAEPVDRAKLLEIFGKQAQSEAAGALERVIERYGGGPERGIRIEEVAGGLRLVTRPELHGYLRKFFEVSGRTRLSMAALETLAIVAYRQPITGPEIQELRGVSPAGVLEDPPRKAIGPDIRAQESGRQALSLPHDTGVPDALRARSARGPTALWRSSRRSSAQTASNLAGQAGERTQLSRRGRTYGVTSRSRPTNREPRATSAHSLAGRHRLAAQGRGDDSGRAGHRQRSELPRSVRRPTRWSDAIKVDGRRLKPMPGSSHYLAVQAQGLHVHATGPRGTADRFRPSSTEIPQDPGHCRASRLQQRGPDDSDGRWRVWPIVSPTRASVARRPTMPRSRVFRSRSPSPN